MKPTSYRGRPLLHLIVLVFVLAAVFYPQGDISAAPVTIPGLFNTGVDSDGNKLNDKDPEENYMLTGAAAAAFVISDGSRPKAWTPSLGQSAWIGPPNGNIEAPGGDYFYGLTFDLAGLVPSTAAISGRWATDNSSEIFLNGVSTGFTRGLAGFNPLWDFEIDSDSGRGFLSGENTLTFKVHNLGPGPTGLLVVDLMGTASEVPIPGAIWLFGSALMALFGIKRRLGA